MYTHTYTHTHTHTQAHKLFQMTGHTVRCLHRDRHTHTDTRVDVSQRLRMLTSSHMCVCMCHTKDGMCFYNGPTLLRHRMLRRRLNHLITLSSYEWSHILRGKESVTTDAVGGFEPLTAQEFEGPGKERSMEYLRTLLGPWMGEQETALAVSEPTQTSSLAQVRGSGMQPCVLSVLPCRSCCEGRGRGCSYTQR